MGETRGAVDPGLQQKLDRAVRNNDELYKRLEATSKGIREQCELEAGDCRVLVSERRGDLVGSATSPSCIGPTDSPAYVRCMASTFAERGQAGPATAYFAFDNWCMRKELACVAKLDVKAQEEARQASARARKETLGHLAENVEAENLAAAGADKVGYLRLSLPPQAQDLCSDDDEVTRCLKDAEERAHELDARVLADDKSYDAARASEVYRQAKNKEASCYVVELRCIVDGLGPRYGIYPESKKWVDRNFGLLEQRRKLANELPLDIADSCLNDTAAARQDALVNAYQQYTSDTVLFFTLQLHKTFASMHEEQIRCLQGQVAAKQKSR